MIYLPPKGLEKLLQSAMEQRRWHRENNHPKTEVNLNFGPLAFTTQECETTQNLMDKYQTMRKEQELEKRKLREKFLKSNNDPQLKEIADAFVKLNGEEMDEALQKTSFKNILPLIEWFEKAAEMSDMAHEKFSNVCDILDLNINAARLESKLVEKGFPTYEQWYDQTTYLVGDDEPVMEEKYAKLTEFEKMGLLISADIQFVSRPGASMSHFWEFTQYYKKEFDKQHKNPQRIQKGHAKTPRIKPDSSRGDRTDSF